MFDWATITLGIGPHSSFKWIAILGWLILYCVTKGLVSPQKWKYFSSHLTAVSELCHFSVFSSHCRCPPSPMLVLQVVDNSASCTEVAFHWRRNKALYRLAVVHTIAVYNNHQLEFSSFELWSCTVSPIQLLLLLQSNLTVSLITTLNCSVG